MAEYIDKSDTETVFREIRKRLSAKKKDYEAIEFLIKYQMLSVAEEVIHAIPAADVRPVVYCKECKHRPVEEYGRITAPKYADGYTDYKCPFLCDDYWYNRMPADDYYCSLGGKRGEYDAD